MALPAVLGWIGSLAAQPEVRRAATKLVGDVYGRLMTRKQGQVVVAPVLDGQGKVDPMAALAARLDEFATRDELIASFAVLQAELDRRHRRTHAMLAGVIALQAVLIAIVLLR